MAQAADTLMAREAAETPTRVAAQAAANAPLLADLGSCLRAFAPDLVLTCARGSSDHAATFGKYLIETELGVPVASFAPSIASLYGQSLVKGRKALFLAISQSGRSPDLIAAAENAKADGALVVSLVNDEAAPLAALADVCVPLRAGAETSVAATKSFLCSLSALAGLTAAWRGEGALSAALPGLPEALEATVAQEVELLPEGLIDRREGLFVIGRGHTFAAAGEAALKFKETCGLHAEAYSAAEVKHGPMALAHDGFPVLMLAPSDAAGQSVTALKSDFLARGANVRVIGCGAGEAIDRALPAPGHAALDPIVQVLALYPQIAALSLARGHDPDRPPFLAKVTRTV
jgi:glutamine---fructose-6-phosphate transaminase (isomerizing)